MDLAALSAARSLDGGGGGRAPLNARFAFATVQGACQSNRREQVAELWHARDRQLQAAPPDALADDAAWETRRREAAARDAARRAEREAGTRLDVLGVALCVVRCADARVRAAEAEEAALAAAEEAAVGGEGGADADALRRLLASRAKRGRGEVGPATEALPLRAASGGSATSSSSSSSSDSGSSAAKKRRRKKRKSERKSERKSGKDGKAKKRKSSKDKSDKPKRKEKEKRKKRRREDDDW